jgi:hypothetical protein
MAVKAVAGSKAMILPSYRLAEKNRKKSYMHNMIFNDVSSSKSYRENVRFNLLSNTPSKNELKKIAQSTFTPRSSSSQGEYAAKSEQLISDSQRILLSLIEKDNFTEIGEILDKTLYHTDHLTFKENTALAIVQLAILKQQRSVLYTSLATNLQLHEKSLSYFLKAIEKLKALPISQEKILYLSRIANELQAISNIPSKYHNLSPFEMIQLCLEAEHTLDIHPDKTTTAYLRASVENLPRSMVIDFQRKKFTILSGKHGALEASGGFKKVTDAIQLMQNEAGEPVAKRMVKLVNKADKLIYDKELEYEKRFGNIDSIIYYKPKYANSNDKTAILADAYDHDMYIYTGYTSTEKRQKLSFGELLTVLEQIGNALQKMHSEGVVHRDVKTKNILFQKTAVDGIKVKLCDFGHTDEPKNEIVHVSKARRHGTVRYSAPEVLEFSSGKHNPFFEQKAIDMYGLGMVIYELFYQKPCPWAHDVFRALKHNEKDSKVKALSAQKKKAVELFEESAQEPHTPERGLITIMAKLLDPDFTQRMQIDEFQIALANLKESYATNKP